MGFKNYSKKDDKEIKHKVVKKIGVLDSDSPNSKELRVVEWNGSVKYDIRSWKQNEDGTETPLKGITLDGEELQSLFDILTEMNEDDESEAEEDEEI